MNYERLETESAKAFHAFELYVQMGKDRSLAKVGRALGKSTHSVEKLSRRHNWVARTAEFDKGEESRRRDLFRTQADEANQRHIKIAQKILEKGEKALIALEKRKLKISAYDTLRFLEVGAKLEREALNIPSRLDITTKGEELVLPTAITVEIIHTNKQPDKA